jgi:hypothetical protein
MVPLIRAAGSQAATASAFLRVGFRLWGARTISSDPEWKYVNLRCYFTYLERSIDKGMQWAVFQPTGEPVLGECPARHRGLPLQSILIRRARTAHRKAPEHAFKHQGRALLSYAPESLRKGKENFFDSMF